MLGITLELKGDNCWLDLVDKEVIHLGNDSLPIRLALLHGGMASGKASVTIRLDLPDNKVILAETSLELLSTATRTIEAAAGQDET